MAWYSFDIHINWLIENGVNFTRDSQHRKDDLVAGGYHLTNIKLRDNQDTNRKHSPLKKANDAILINTDNLTANQVIDVTTETVRKLL